MSDEPVTLNATFDYQTYLASREWGLLKRAVRERSGGRCERCKSGPYQETHHLTYARIGRESLDDLQGLCRPCHAFLSGVSDVDPLDTREEEPSACAGCGDAKAWSVTFHRPPQFRLCEKCIDKAAKLLEEARKRAASQRGREPGGGFLPNEVDMLRDLLHRARTSSGPGPWVLDMNDRASLWHRCASNQGEAVGRNPCLNASTIHLAAGKRVHRYYCSDHLAEAKHVVWRSEERYINCEYCCCQHEIGSVTCYNVRQLYYNVIFDSSDRDGEAYA